MVRIVTTLVLLVVVAVFIGLNLPYRTTVDLFGWKLEDAPSIIVILASVSLGILLSLSVFFLSFLSRRSRGRLQKRIDELASREKAVEQAAKETPAARSETAQATGSPGLDSPAPAPLGARRRRR